MKFNNIEQKIKDQIDDREIAPSKNLWSAIEQELDHSPKKKNEVWKWMIAASTVLVLGLSFILFNQSDSTTSTLVAKQSTTIEKSSEKITTAQQHNNKIVENSSNETITKDNKVQAVVHQKSNETNETQTVPQQIHFNTENLIKEKENISKNALAISPDSIKGQTPKIKKKYTDANALLFSVENKDAIKETRDGSNVAKIEIEKK